MRKIVIVKLQRPLVTNSSNNEVLSYIVDKDGEQISNPIMEEMSQEDVDKLFGEYYKVFYKAKYRPGDKLLIKKPIWRDEWI